MTDIAIDAFPVTFLSQCTEDTESIGRALAQKLEPGTHTPTILTLYGEMGVGKTALVRGFCDALGIRSVRSPTYTIVNEYGGASVPVVHMDLYRLENEEDLYSVGYDDYLTRCGFLLIEWPQRMETALAPQHFCVRIDRVPGQENARRITVAEVRA